MRPLRRSRRSWPILMERFFKIAFRDVLFWKRCVKCTDLDSDGHIRNGYGQESSKPDWYVSVQIRPMLDLNSDSLYGLDWTSMDFGQNHLKSWIGLYGLLWKERRARSRHLSHKTKNFSIIKAFGVFRRPFLTHFDPKQNNLSVCEKNRNNIRLILFW